MWNLQLSDPNTDQFNGYRFYELPQLWARTKKPKSDGDSQLHGIWPWRHACLGRLFAATAVEIILWNILPKYEVKLLDGSSLTIVWRGDAQVPERTCQIEQRGIGSGCSSLGCQINDLADWRDAHKRLSVSEG